MKKFLLLISFGIPAYTSMAQRYIGASNDAYNTINSLYLNPAYLAGCNEKLAVNLFSFNIGVDNNLGTLTSISDIGKTTGKDSGGIDIFNPTGSRSKFSMMVPGIELRGPSFLYRVNARHTFAFTTRVRAFNEFNNFDRSLYTSINNPSGVNTSVISFSAQDFNWTASVWSEFGLSYGGEVFSTDELSIKAGASLRYLAGAGYLGIKGKNMDVTYVGANDSFHATNTDIEYASNIRTVSDNISNGVSGSQLLGGQAGGHGISADLGAIATYKTENETEKYTALLSIAVTDLGSITYNTSYDVAIKGNGYLKGDEIGQNVKNYQDLRNYVSSRGFSVDTGTVSRKLHLPTTMVIGADYHAWKNIFVSATVIANMTNNSNFGSSYYGQFTISPRYQSKIFTGSLPITYSALSHHMRMGIGLRLGGFFMGSDDMLALFSSSQYGFNYYVGGMIPIYRTKKSPEKDNSN